MRGDCDQGTPMTAWTACDIEKVARWLRGDDEIGVACPPRRPDRGGAPWLLLAAAPCCLPACIDGDGIRSPREEMPLDISPRIRRSPACGSRRGTCRPLFSDEAWPPRHASLELITVGNDSGRD